jgi:hypothetical protein
MENTRFLPIVNGGDAGMVEFYFQRGMDNLVGL